MIFSVIVTLVLKMKEIVMLMMSVKTIFFVDQAIVKLQLVLPLKLIVVINQLLEMNIFVHLEFFVERMKEIVILTMSVNRVFFVGITTVLLLLISTMKLIAVVVLKLRVQIILIHIRLMHMRLGC